MKELNNARLESFYDLLAIQDMQEFYLTDGVCTERNEFRFENGVLKKLLTPGQFGEVGSHYIGRLLNNELQIQIKPSLQLTDSERKQLKAIYFLFGECKVTRDRFGKLTIWGMTETPKKNYTADFWQRDNITVLTKTGKDVYSIDSKNLSFIKWDDTKAFVISQQLIDSLTKENLK